MCAWIEIELGRRRVCVARIIMYGQVWYVYIEVAPDKN